MNSKNYNTGTSGNPNDPDGWTFSFRFKLDVGQLYNTTDSGATEKNIGIIQLTHVTSSKPIDDTTLREISFGVQYSSSESKYVFKLSGGIQLKTDGGDYPTIKDNTWYHVVITRQTIPQTQSYISIM